MIPAFKDVLMIDQFYSTKEIAMAYDLFRISPFSSCSGGGYQLFAAFESVNQRMEGRRERTMEAV